MAELIFSVATIKYGTPTGSTTMPIAGAMVQLPDTIRGTISIEEAEGNIQRFFTDQKPAPVNSLQTDIGLMTITAQFYDLSPINVAALKGGTPTTGATVKYVPSPAFALVNKAIEIAFDSGHKLNIYNGSITARFTGGGGRDKMLGWEVKIVPQATADLGAPYDYGH